MAGQKTQAGFVPSPIFERRSIAWRSLQKALDEFVDTKMIAA